MPVFRRENRKEPIVDWAVDVGCWNRAHSVVLWVELAAINPR